MYVDYTIVKYGEGWTGPNNGSTDWTGAIKRYRQELSYHKPDLFIVGSYIMKSQKKIIPEVWNKHIFSFFSHDSLL